MLIAMLVEENVILKQSYKKKDVRSVVSVIDLSEEVSKNENGKIYERRSKDVG